MLDIRDLSVSYGPIQAVRGVSLSVAKGEIVALLGANGAGKSSILKAVMGIAPRSAGKVRLAGEEIGKADTAAIVRRGLTLVPEGRRVFGQLTVFENLCIGAATRELRRNTQKNCERMYALSPKLAERSAQLAGSLSGGEQQMLAIARALMAEPRMLLLDEPSLGLAPNIVDQIFDFLKTLQKQGLTLLIVEQNAEVALDIAGRGMVLAQGRIGKEGSGMRAAANDFDVARLMGINANRVIAVAFALSGLLAGIAGILWLFQRGSVDPLMGFVPVLKAFIAVVLGGMGSLLGAVAGGFILGVVEVLLRAFLPDSLLSYRDAISLSIVIAILYFYPDGLVPRRENIR